MFAFRRLARVKAWRLSQPCDTRSQPATGFQETSVQSMLVEPVIQYMTVQSKDLAKMVPRVNSLSQSIGSREISSMAS